MHLDEPFHYGKSDSKAAFRTVQVSAPLHEKVKDLREQFRGSSAPVVRNLDDRSPFVGAGADANLPARVGVLRGVSDDVADALDQARPVASHKGVDGSRFR